MADNKKYYYIKLKDNYFDQDNIKILESMDNGYIYSLIIVKLCLKAAKNDGRLMMTSTIPYNPQRVDILANVIGHDVAHVREAIRYGIELDLITIIEGEEIWLNDIQNFIGQSTTEADRIRNYRKKLDNSVQMYDKSTPELKKELKKEIDTSVDDCKWVLEQFKTICKSLAIPRGLTVPRKTAIKNRIKEYSKEDIISVFNIAEKSKFLSGKSSPRWKASFDWLLLPKNFIKVIEGNYTDVVKKPLIEKDSNYDSPTNAKKMEF